MCTVTGNGLWSGLGPFGRSQAFVSPVGFSIVEVDGILTVLSTGTY